LVEFLPILLIKAISKHFSDCISADAVNLRFGKGSFPALLTMVGLIEACMHCRLPVRTPLSSPPDLHPEAAYLMFNPRQLT
jgi:hypothetical protein